MAKNRSSSIQDWQPDQVDTLQVPERPSVDEAKAAIMHMRGVVVVKFKQRQIDGRTIERFNIYIDGICEFVGVGQDNVGAVAAKYYPICVGDPHLIFLAERMPLRRL